VYRGKVQVHGLLDMVREPNGKSFSHLQYPSTLPAEVQRRMAEVSARVLTQVGFDNSCFNVEFMWDAAADKLWLIEVNTRMSQSHSELFMKVDGVSNHQIAISLALGRQPRFPHRQGHFATAAKFWINKYGDAQVTHVPSAEEIRALEMSTPGEPHIDIGVREGCRLSELPNQDAYRYVLGEAYLGGESEAEVLANYRRCVAGLHFGFTAASPADGSRDLSA
jgi:biotin carboxylase